MRIVLETSPKIRALLTIVPEAVRDGRKLCIWTLLPAQQILLWDIVRVEDFCLHVQFRSIKERPCTRE
jgi:hypothetical protein